MNPLTAFWFTLWILTNAGEAHKVQVGPFATKAACESIQKGTRITTMGITNHIPCKTGLEIGIK